MKLFWIETDMPSFTIIWIQVLTRPSLSSISVIHTYSTTNRELGAYVGQNSINPENDCKFLLNEIILESNRHA